MRAAGRAHEHRAAKAAAAQTPSRAAREAERPADTGDLGRARRSRSTSLAAANRGQRGPVPAPEVQEPGDHGMDINETMLATDWDYPMFLITSPSDGGRGLELGTQSNDGGGGGGGGIIAAAGCVPVGGLAVTLAVVAVLGAMGYTHNRMHGSSR
jgi:hypothetical protein